MFFIHVRDKHCLNIYYIKIIMKMRLSFKFLNNFETTKNTKITLKIIIMHTY